MARRLQFRRFSRRSASKIVSGGVPSCVLRVARHNLRGLYVDATALPSSRASCARCAVLFPKLLLRVLLLQPFAVPGRHALLPPDNLGQSGRYGAALHSLRRDLLDRTVDILL